MKFLPTKLEENFVNWIGLANPKYSHSFVKMERGEIDKGIRKLLVETEGEEIMRERIMHLKEKVDLSIL